MSPSSHADNPARSTAAAPPRGGGGSPRRALITGVTGQDGSYLAELLLAKGYEVHGVIRRSSSFNTARISHIFPGVHAHAPSNQPPVQGAAGLTLHYGDVTDSNTLAVLVRTVRPDEVYNLAAQSHVQVSFQLPVYTAEAVGLGTLRMLECLREYQHQTGHAVRFYQASSSEQFGKAQQIPQSEATPFYPRSPYAVAKVFAHWATVNYRESYNLHASCGILFNHESPRRGETFVTRKITRAVGRIKLGLQSSLFLGNLDAQRDWGFAGDYVRAMWAMLQQPAGDDYVIATGRSMSVREFAERAFAHVGLEAKDFIRIDQRYMRPSEVDTLCGDASKARRALAWEPTTSIADLIRMMVEGDLELAAREKTLRDAGHDVGGERAR